MLAWESTIEMLAAGEAYWRERAIRAEAEREAYQLVARQAIHELREVSMKCERQQQRIVELLEARRAQRLRKAA